MSVLSPQQRQQVEAALKKAGVKFSCPACASALEVSPDLHALPIAAHSRGPGATPTGYATMCATLRCRQCGLHQLHSLVPLGLDSML